jgi:hypothetical protein
VVLASVLDNLWGKFVGFMRVSLVFFVLTIIGKTQGCAKRDKA